jgi:metal-sulfur cluster biosynthetic enzyme
MSATAPSAWSVGEPLAGRITGLLDAVVDPCSAASVLSMSIVQLGLIRDVSWGDDDAELVVHLRLTSPSCMMVTYIAREVTERLGTLPGVLRVRVEPDEGLDWDPSMMDPHVAQERARRLVHLDLASLGRSAS